MNADRPVGVRDLFDAVFELADSAREARLRELGADEALIAKVLRMIRASDRTQTTQVGRIVKGMLDDTTSRGIGDVVGAWRIDSEIGEGGMGRVFLVERNDGHFRQTAALKFLRGLPRSETLEYFTRERQVLASLTHPNIARLLDGGATEAGIPYLVMEFVDGIAINEYCMQQRLSIDAILSLFMTACEGVAFAHRQLIVHCDLKPSNLMVSRDGRPVLLDFGIARLTDRVGEEAGQSNQSAQNTSPAFTPRYSSPEQRAQRPLSTASDIYSLGVMLRELVGFTDQTNAASLSRRVHELNAICVRATEHDPASRYATVDALTADIRRYLSNETLQAMPATTVYRARKLLDRRWPVVLGVALFVATVAGFTMRVVIDRNRAIDAERRALDERDATRLAETETAKQRDKTALERDRATIAERATTIQRSVALTERDNAKASETKALAERNRAVQAEAASNQTSEFLASIFENSNPDAEITDIPAQRLLATAEERLEKDLQGRAETQSALFAALARAQANLGNHERARELYLRSIRIERNRNRPLVLAELLDHLAKLQSTAAGSSSAEREAREALALREQFAGPNADETAESLRVLGGILANSRRADAAEPLLLRSVSIREQLRSKSGMPSVGLADSLSMLSRSYSQRRLFDKAIATMRQAMTARAAATGDDNEAYILELRGFGRLLSRAEQVTEAEAVLRQALASYKALRGAANSSYAALLAELARFLADSGRPREALPMYAEALAITEAKKGGDKAVFGVMLSNAAAAAHLAGDEATALRHYAKAIEVLSGVRGDRNLAVSRHRSQYAAVLMSAGQLAQAREKIDLSMKMRIEILGTEHEDVLRSRLLLAEWFVRSGDIVGAQVQLDLVAVLEAKISLPPLQAQSVRLRALLNATNGNIELALAGLEKSEQLDRQQWPVPDPRFYLSTLDRSELLAKSAKPEDKATSLRLVDEMLAGLADVLVADAPILARIKKLQRQ